MIYFQRKLRTEFPIESNQYEEGLGDISTTIRSWLEESNYVQAETGLYLGTSNAGVFESVDFWKNTLAQSPRFANPANFNWTLSNGPASYLSRVLKIKGPCYTLVGGSQAIGGCFFHASEDLSNGVVSHAIICGLDIYDGQLHFCACLISAESIKSAFDLASVMLHGKKEKYAFISLAGIEEI